MKEYHTEIVINTTIQKVWEELVNFDEYPKWNPIVGKLEGEMIVGNKISTYIVPLKKTYYPKLVTYQIHKELTWKGVQVAGFILAGRHYYKLEQITNNKTKLLHGECFTGLLSVFIKEALLKKMQEAFILHNEFIKQRIENEN